MSSNSPHRSGKSSTDSGRDSRSDTSFSHATTLTDDSAWMLLNQTIRHYEERTKDYGVLRCELWLSRDTTAEAGASESNDPDRVSCWRRNNSDRFLHHPSQKKDDEVVTLLGKRLANQLWIYHKDRFDPRIKWTVSSNEGIQWIGSSSFDVPTVASSSTAAASTFDNSHRGMVCWIFGTKNDPHPSETSSTEEDSSRTLASPPQSNLESFLRSATDHIASTYAMEAFQEVPPPLPSESNHGTHRKTVLIKAPESPEYKPVPTRQSQHPRPSRRTSRLSKFDSCEFAVSDSYWGKNDDGEESIDDAENPAIPKAVVRRRSTVYAEVPFAASVKIPLFSPPRQRQKWGSDQVLPHVNWGDLFFDLFYVAGFYNMGNILKNDPSFQGVLYFVGCFFPMRMLWQTKMWYDSRFVYGDDIFHKIFETLYLLAVASAVSYIAPVSRMSKPSEHSDMFGFALSLTTACFFNILRFVECYFLGRGQRPIIKKTATSDIMWLTFPFVLYLAAAALAGIDYFGKENPYDDGYESKYAIKDKGCDDINQSNLPLVLCLLGWVAWQSLVVIKIVFFYGHVDKLKTTIPLNIDFGLHRCGEWTMLVLGESVLSLLIVDALGRDYYMAFYSGILSIIMLQLLHFRSSPHDPDDHALRRSKDASMLWSLAFTIYSAALVAVGATYKLILYTLAKESSYKRKLTSFEEEEHFLLRWLGPAESDYSYGYSCGPTTEEQKQMVAYLFSGSLALVFICLDIMTLTHVGWKEEKKKLVYQGSVTGGFCARCCTKVKNFNYKGLFFVIVPRIGITFFVGNLGVWVTNPRTLAELGFVAVVCQLITRLLGNIFLPDIHGHHSDHSHHPDYVDDEDDIGYLNDIVMNEDGTYGGLMDETTRMFDFSSSNDPSRVFEFDSDDMKITREISKRSESGRSKITRDASHKSSGSKLSRDMSKKISKGLG